MAASGETGIQLIARLGKKITLEGCLEPTLLPKGPRHKDIIELYGEEGSGKTQMLIHLIANSILPSDWNQIQINGLGVSVIFLDTDNHLSLIRLATLLEARLLQCVKLCGAASPTPEAVEELVKSCFQRLFIVRCRSSAQLLVTLDYIENLLASKPDIGLLMIDSISAFYWIDKYAGGDNLHAQELNLKRISFMLEKIVAMYNLVVLATKQVVYQRRRDQGTDNMETGLEHCEFLTKPWTRIINTRFMFSKETPRISKVTKKEENIFSVWLDSSGKKKQYFTITDGGVSFL